MLFTGSEEHNSSPIVLGIAGAIVVSSLGGWLLLRNDTSAVVDEQTDTSAMLAIAMPHAPATDDAVDVDTELRKARLSAEAGLLVSPERRNALYFYTRVLAADAEHEVAKAELDALMASISRTVDDHLAADELDDAYDLAVSAAGLVPGHWQISVMRDDLQDFTDALASEAVAFAQTGNDSGAMTVLASLDGLSGLNSDSVEAARRAVAEEQRRRAAEQEQLDAEQLAKEQADLEWEQSVRNAIAAGYLLRPEGESARDLLETGEAVAEVKDLLMAELRTALIGGVSAKLEAAEPGDAEAYLIAAREIGVDDESLAELQVAVDQALIEQQGSQMVALTDFTRLSTPAAEYPRFANERNIVGWVDVAFTVTSAGKTANIDIISAEPAEVFENSVIEAVEQWTFVPRQFRGQPIDQRTAARLVFNLE